MTAEFEEAGSIVGGEEALWTRHPQNLSGGRRAQSAWAGDCGEAKLVAGEGQFKGTRPVRYDIGVELGIEHCGPSGRAYRRAVPDSVKRAAVGRPSSGAMLRISVSRRGKRKRTYCVESGIDQWGPSGRRIQGVRAAVGRRSGRTMLRIQSVAAEGRGGSGRTVIMQWRRALGPETAGERSQLSVKASLRGRTRRRGVGDRPVGTVWASHTGGPSCSRETIRSNDAEDSVSRRRRTRRKRTYCDHAVTQSTWTGDCGQGKLIAGEGQFGTVGVKSGIDQWGPSGRRIQGVRAAVGRRSGRTMLRIQALGAGTAGKESESLVKASLRERTHLIDATDTDTRGAARKDAEHPHSVYHRAIGSRRRRSDLALCNDRAKVVQSAHRIDLLRDPPRIEVVALQERFCALQREQEGPHGS
ncbi:hypothetical protein C8R46DRAFT_1044797 [Mycena filopes]|nr:hypothetical protein C8R46DRAFT_1044797 [Mycena filopes]